MIILQFCANNLKRLQKLVGNTSTIGRIEVGKRCKEEQYLEISSVLGPVLVLEPQLPTVACGPTVLVPPADLVETHLPDISHLLLTEHVRVLSQLLADHDIRVLSQLLADHVLNFLEDGWRRLFVYVKRQLVGDGVSVGDLNPQGSDI